MSNESQLRIIQSLHHVPEHSFYSEAVQTTIDDFNNIKTLKELIEKSTREYQDQIRNVFERDMRRDANKYNAFLNRVKELENTFSFDVDYI